MGSNITIGRGGWRSTGRRVLSTLVAALVAIGLAACGTGPGGGSGEVKDAGAAAQARAVDADAGHAVLLRARRTRRRPRPKRPAARCVQTTNANRDSGQQVTDIRNLITAGANAIMAGIADRKAIQPALDYAASRGVPVVVVDDQPAAGPVAAVVKADNYGMGVTAAENLGAAAATTAARSCTSPAVWRRPTVGTARTASTRPCKAKFPELQVIEQTAEVERPRGGQRHDDGAEPEPRHRRRLPRHRHALPRPGQRRADRSRAARPGRPARTRRHGRDRRRRRRTGLDPRRHPRRDGLAAGATTTPPTASSTSRTRGRARS